MIKFPSSEHILPPPSPSCNLTKFAIGLALCLDVSLNFLWITSLFTPYQSFSVCMPSIIFLYSTHHVLFFTCFNIALLILLFFLGGFPFLCFDNSRPFFFPLQFPQNINICETVYLFFFEDTHPISNTLLRKITCFWNYFWHFYTFT